MFNGARLMAVSVFISLDSEAKACLLPSILIIYMERPKHDFLDETRGVNQLRITQHLTGDLWGSFRIHAIIEVG